MTTSINKWWQRVSLWNKVRIMLAAIGVGGEITLYLGDAYVGWNIVAGLSTFTALGISLFFTDENHNGVVDELESK